MDAMPVSGGGSGGGGQYPQPQYPQPQPPPQANPDPFHNTQQVAPQPQGGNLFGGQTLGGWRGQQFNGPAPTLNGMAMRTNFAETAPHASSNPYQAMAAAGMYANPLAAQQNATKDQMGQWRNWVGQSQAYNDSPDQVQARLAAARAAGNNPILAPQQSAPVQQAAPGLSLTPQQMHDQALARRR